jgi:DNA-binding Lrp family transcriptional regulator
MSMAARRPPALDRVDISILVALQRNGRSTVQGLAEQVELSPRACLERLRRLEAAKIITGYQAVVDIARLSRPINVFAEIILDKQARQARFEQRLDKIDELVECWQVGGTVDYIARFVCPDLAIYEALTTRLIEDPNLGVARIISRCVRSVGSADIRNRCSPAPTNKPASRYQPVRARSRFGRGDPEWPPILSRAAFDSPPFAVPDR